MKKSRAIFLTILGLTALVVIVYPLFVLFFDPGENYIKRFTSIDIPPEVISFDPSKDNVDLRLVESYFRDQYIKTKVSQANGAGWYNDTCFADTVRDFRIVSTIHTSESTSLFFITYIADRYNFCVNQGKSPISRTITCLPIFADKIEKDIEVVGGGCIKYKSFYYKGNKIDLKDEMNKTIYESQVVEVLKQYKYYKFIFLSIKIKSDDFVKHIRNACTEELIENL